jgi:hypothetical protein
MSEKTGLELQADPSVQTTDLAVKTASMRPSKMIRLRPKLWKGLCL